LFYLRLLDECCRLNDAIFSAYSLVPNHIHLLIRRGRVSLARTMQRLQGNYAAYFNRRHRRTGHLFEGRYHAFLVTDEIHLHALVRYIHQNLPKDGMVKENENILWSSHALYFGKKNSPWTRWRTTPGYEGKSGAKAYRQLMGYSDEAIVPPMTPERPWAYGTEGMWRKFERRKSGREADKRGERRGKETIEKIVYKISRKNRVSMELLRSAARARSVSRIRNEAVLACLSKGHGPSDTSRFFRRRPSSIGSIIRRYGDPRKKISV